MPNRFNDHTSNVFIADADDEMWGLLSIYVDGEASPAEAARVEDLLRSDSVYARQFAFLKSTAAVVQTFSELDPPPSLRSAILASTSQRVTWGARLMSIRDAIRRLHTPRYVMSLAGLAAAALLAIVVVQHYSSQSGNGNLASATRISHPTASTSLGAKQPILTENEDPDIDWSADIPPIATGTHQPRVTRPRTVPAALLSTSTKKTTRVAVLDSPPVRPRIPFVHHVDNSGVAIATVYQPDKDAQFERNPGTAASIETQPVEIPGDDIHIADSDVMPSGIPDHPISRGSVESTVASSQRPVTHTYVAKLTALPPDPNQVLTRADMARNRAIMTSGYDRSTLKSMERKEASISILRGTF